MEIKNMRIVMRSCFVSLSSSPFCLAGKPLILSAEQSRGPTEIVMVDRQGMTMADSPTRNARQSKSFPTVAKSERETRPKMREGEGQDPTPSTWGQ